MKRGVIVIFILLAIVFLYGIVNVSAEVNREELNRSIEKKLFDIERVNNQIKTYDDFTELSLKALLDLETSKETVEDIQEDFNNATLEAEFEDIEKRLEELEIPESLRVSSSVNAAIYYPQERNIDIEILSEITGETYSFEREEQYIDLILSWNIEKIETKITFREISARINSSDKPLLKIFEIRTNEIKTLGESPFLIIKNLENLRFSQYYSETEHLGYYYIPLRPQNTISFSTSEDVNFVNLPMFIAPRLSDLTIIDIPENEEEERLSKSVILILSISFLLIGGFVTYVILQEWYRKKYEEHLFKNRNNLFNLITYIEHSRSKGINDGKIKSKLKKSKWNYEQISYAMKKHAGKRTGMIEIPFKLFKKKSKKFRKKIPKKQFNLKRKKGVSPRKTYKRF